MSTKYPSELEQAAEEQSGGPFAEYWAFLRHSRKWWLLPILVLLLLFGLVLLLVCPFEHLRGIEQIAHPRLAGLAVQGGHCRGARGLVSSPLRAPQRVL